MVGLSFILDLVQIGYRGWWDGLTAVQKRLVCSGNVEILSLELTHAQNTLWDHRQRAVVLLFFHAKGCTCQDGIATSTTSVWSQNLEILSTVKALGTCLLRCRTALSRGKNIRQETPFPVMLCLLGPGKMAPLSTWYSPVNILAITYLRNRQTLFILVTLKTHWKSKCSSVNQYLNTMCKIRCLTFYLSGVRTLQCCFCCCHRHNYRKHNKVCHDEYKLYYRNYYFSTVIQSLWIS